MNKELGGWFNQKYGQKTQMTIHRGPKLEYLGMNIAHTKVGKVRITMYGYIYETMAECPAEFAGTFVTPEGLCLFEISDEATKLDKSRAGVFHRISAKLLYLSERARSDIQLAVSLLCTRVRAADEHDWKKVGCPLKCLRQTSKLPLILEEDHTNVVKWWVNAAFAVTADMRNHSGGTMSMGKDSIYSASMRQCIITRSSTEA